MSAARVLSASAAIGLAVMVAGCESSIRQNATDFTPQADGRFLFTSVAGGAEFPLDDPDAEARRMRWLDQYIVDNRFCPSGEYEVVSRTPIFEQSGLFEDMYRIHYEGQCLP